MATNGNLNHSDQHLAGPTEQYAATSAVESANATGASTSNLPKDEVGWYFVEQYYTTLSKSPDKLHVSAACPMTGNSTTWNKKKEG